MLLMYFLYVYSVKLEVQKLEMPIMFYTEIILHTHFEEIKQILRNVNQRHIGHAEIFVAKTTSLSFFIF